MSILPNLKPILAHLAIAAALALSPLADAGDDAIVTTIIEGDFTDVSESVRAAIVGKGINIAHELPAGDMLHRTGPAFGYTDDVYADAQTFEFCSAGISHKLARVNPDNIVLCPFTISVYVLTAEPGKVRLSYRIPTGKPGSDAAVAEVVELVQSIVEDASW